MLRLQPKIQLQYAAYQLLRLLQFQSIATASSADPCDEATRVQTSVLPSEETFTPSCALLAVSPSSTDAHESEERTLHMSTSSSCISSCSSVHLVRHLLSLVRETERAGHFNVRSAAACLDWHLSANLTPTASLLTLVLCSRMPSRTPSPAPALSVVPDLKASLNLLFSSLVREPFRYTRSLLVEKLQLVRLAAALLPRWAHSLSESELSMYSNFYCCIRTLQQTSTSTRSCAIISLLYKYNGLLLQIQIYRLCIVECAL